MSTNICAGFIFLLSRLLSLWRHWALVAAVLLCILQKRSLAEQSNPVQGKTIVLPLNHAVAFLLFCVCYMTQTYHLPVSLWTSREEVISGCSSHWPAQRGPSWALAVHLCCDREQMVNYFFSPWGNTPPVLFNGSLFTLKGLLWTCVNLNYVFVTVDGEELMFRS